MIAFTCPSCPRELSVEDEQAGKQIQCPGCGELLNVPQANAAALAIHLSAHPLLPGGAVSPLTAPRSHVRRSVVSLRAGDGREAEAKRRTRSIALLRPGRGF